MNKTDVLVIDEISMVENNFFTRLNEVMKAARGSSQPFGGVQLVVTGDVSVAATLRYAKTNAIPVLPTRPSEAFPELFQLWKTFERTIMMTNIIAITGVVRKTSSTTLTNEHFVVVHGR